MTSPDEIVVFAEPVIEDLGDAWIARLPKLGLTSTIYERKDRALADLYEGFADWAQRTRQRGTLERYLRDSGLTWGLAADFPEAKSRFRG